MISKKLIFEKGLKLFFNLEAPYQQIREYLTFFVIQYKKQILWHSALLILTFFVLFGNFIQEKTFASFWIQKEPFSSSQIEKFVESVKDYTPLISEDPLLLAEKLGEGELPLIFEEYLLKPSLTETKKTEVPTPKPRSSIITYTVSFGDTLGKIAREFGLKTETLSACNEIPNIHQIKPGLKLLIPPVDGIIHTVKKDETLTSIVEKYKGDLFSTLKYNDLSEKYLKIGQKIVVAGGKKVPAPKRELASRPSRLRSTLPRETGSVSGLFSRPTYGFALSQGFSHWHRGIDLNSKSGLSILAAREGKVEAVKYGWSGGYGNHLIISHQNGFSTLYAHLSSIYIKRGSYVQRRQIIGEMGRTGWASGIHLHFEIRKNGIPVNPLEYIR